MKKCYFTLTLPGGDIIKIPANLSTLDKTEKIDTAFNKWFTLEEGDSKIEAKNEFVKLIQSLTKNKLSSEGIVKIINKSSNIDKFYDLINNEIENFGTMDNIGEAVRQYIYSQYKSTEQKITRKQAIATLKKQLSKKRDASYFKKLNVKGLIGVSSLRDEKTRLNYLKEESDLFGFLDPTTDNLNTFLSAVISKSKDIQDSKILYKSSNIPTGKAWVDNGFVLYDKSDDIYLFLALFKKEAIEIPFDKLKEKLIVLDKALKQYNHEGIDLENFDINKFFIGTTTEEGFMPSDFELLMDFAKKNNLKSEINNILNLVADNIDSTNIFLKTSIKNLFWQLYPKSYGQEALNDILKERKKLQEYLDAEKVLKANKIDFEATEQAKIPFNYAPKNTLSGANLFLKAKQNLTPYQDMVKFNSYGDSGMYGIVRGIYQRSDNSVIVYGVRKLPNGELMYMDEVFDDKITYRKKSTSDPYDPMETILPNEGVPIYAPENEFLNYNVIRSLLSKGDEIDGRIVVGIYPEFLRLQNKKSGEIKELYYGKIRSIYSKKVLEEIKKEVELDVKGLVKIENSNDLVAGDYYIYSSAKGDFYKRILYTDDNYVYSWVPNKNKDGYIVKGEPREGLQGYKNSLAGVRTEDIKEIVSELELIGKSKATMSSFVNVVDAQPGDYVYEEFNDIKYYGLVVENSRVYLRSSTNNERLVIKSLSDLQNPIFFTTRDIANSYGAYVSNVNDLEIKFKKESNSGLDEEAIFVVPIDFDTKNLKLIAGNQFNVGKFQAKSANITADLKEATEEAKMLLNKVTTPYIQLISKKSSGYRRNLDSLYSLENFRKLTKEQKEELAILSRGTYVRLWKESILDSNIYRISEINQDKVTLQLNKMSYDGKLITNEIVLTKDELLAEKIGEKHPINSIGEVYLIRGSNKLQSILEDSSIAETIAPQINLLQETIDKFKVFLGGELGDKISVEIVSKDEFESGQKAKIESIVTEETSKGKVKQSLNVSIKINEETGSPEDVVHEFLHLFLTPLRYKLPEVYFRLIQSVVKDENLNVTEAEEKFVEVVAAKLASQSDVVDFTEVEVFVEGLSRALEIAVPGDFYGDYNAIELLKTPISKVFGLNTKNTKSHPMYNLGMVATEPMMREWLSNNNIIFKCN